MIPPPIALIVNIRVGVVTRRHTLLTSYCRSNRSTQIIRNEWRDKGRR